MPPWLLEVSEAPLLVLQFVTIPADVFLTNIQVTSSDCSTKMKLHFSVYTDHFLWLSLCFDLTPTPTPTPTAKNIVPVILGRSGIRIESLTYCSQFSAMFGLALRMALRMALPEAA